MNKTFINEVWKEFDLEIKRKYRYAISNFGRVMSFTEEFSDGKILKGGLVDGYKMINFKYKEDNKYKHKTIFLHRIIAELFVPKESEEQIQILHLDHNKQNNTLSNLKWATRAEMALHHKTNPLVQHAKEQLIEHNKMRDGHKLTSTQVLFIKKRIFDPNRKTRLKMIAKQFGISEMQLYRIKSGENWGHIKYDGQQTKSK